MERVEIIRWRVFVRIRLLLINVQVKQSIHVCQMKMSQRQH
jgi:hypothetical protein